MFNQSGWLTTAIAEPAADAAATSFLFQFRFSIKSTCVKNIMLPTQCNKPQLKWHQHFTETDNSKREKLTSENTSDTQVLKVYGQEMHHLTRANMNRPNSWICPETQNNNL